MAPPGLLSPSLEKGSDHHKNSGGTGTKKKTTKSVSRSYPRNVGVDFRKLAGLTLVNYIDHHGACVRKMENVHTRVNVFSACICLTTLRTPNLTSL